MQDGFSPAGLPDKFEIGTPNLNGAVSLLYAFEYLEKIGGYRVMEEQERELVEYFLKRLEHINT
jgi:cysteine desulfurase/selenocysteine lyase